MYGGGGSKDKVMKYGEGPGESVVHGPRTSSLRHWSYGSVGNLGVDFEYRTERRTYVIIPLPMLCGENILAYLYKNRNEKWPSLNDQLAKF